MTSPALETQGLTTRTLAADLLRTCLDRKLTVEEAMSSSHDVQRLDARDRAFLSTLLLLLEEEEELSSSLDEPPRFVFTECCCCCC